MAFSGLSGGGQAQGGHQGASPGFGTPPGNTEDPSAMGGGAAGAHHQVMAIEKAMKWKILFFVGACATFGSGLVSLIGLAITFGMFRSPASFTSSTCLVFFGFLMMVLDAPMKAFPWQRTVHLTTYKFALFMTRFTGRGIWYAWLGSMVWVALFDEGGNGFQEAIGIVATIYLILLGIFAGAKGLFLSRRLNKVREMMVSRTRDAYSQYFPAGMQKMPKEQFRALFQDNDQQPLSEDDLDYVINAIANICENEGNITVDDFQEWVNSTGTMYLV